MPQMKQCLLVICMLLLGSVEAKRYFETYKGAVTGEVVNLGAVSYLLDGSKDYAKGDCEAAFLNLDAAGNSTLELADKDLNDPDSKAGSREVYVVATLKSKSGNLSYKLKCSDKSGVGIIEVHDPNELIVSSDSSIQMELTADKADRTQYAFLRGIQGNKISETIKQSDKSSYFEAYLGGLSNLKFYERKDDGSLLEVKTSNFGKILPIKELDSENEGVQSERDISSTIAVIQGDGATVSFYDLENDLKLGRVYVHTGNKAIGAGKDYTLGHCFPALRNNTLTNYYCIYESSDPKKQLPIKYFDVTAEDDNLESRDLSGVSSVIAAKPMSDGKRICLLVLDVNQNRKMICLDARKSLGKTADNEDTYFTGKSFKIKVEDQECEMDINKIDPSDFRFDDAAVFVCKSSSYLASFSLGNSIDEKDPLPLGVNSIKKIESDVTPLCASIDEIVYLTDKNTTLVLEGGFSNPGQLIRVPLGIETSSINKIHCAYESILLTLQSKKNTYLLDITRGNRRDSITRVKRIVNLGESQTHMKVATSKSAILYSIDKKGLISNLVLYQSFFGFVKISNKDQTTPSEHKMIIEISGEGGSQIKQLTVVTNILPSTEFSVKSTKIMENLKPGSEYELRNYFDIDGQVTNINVLYPEPKPRNMFWLADEVRFFNSINGTSYGSKFVIEGVFVDTEHRKYNDADGKMIDLEGDILFPSRHLGIIEIEQPIAFIAKREEGVVYVQGIYLDKDRKVQNTDAVKLFESVDSNFIRPPRLAKIDGKLSLVFYQGTKGKTTTGIAVNYKYSKEIGFQFIELDSQKKVDWNEPNSVNGYTVSSLPKQTSSLSPCAHLEVTGEDVTEKTVYDLCGITGGSSRKIGIYNLSTTYDGKTHFEVINYPENNSGSSSLTWWIITSNLFGEDGAPVNPSEFKYDSKLVRRFDGLEHHNIAKIYNLDEKAVVVADDTEDKSEILYEIYFGARGNSPYYSRRVNDLTTAINEYSLKFAVVGKTVKRIYVNHAKDFSNVADVEFRDSRLRLSKHAATVHMKRPFTLMFNNVLEVREVIVELDKFYEDDGKTDEDDDNRDPEEDPTNLQSDKPKTRLWSILAILGMIFIVGAVDLCLRRRNALADHKKEEAHDKPRVTIKPKGENGGEYASINDA